MVRLKPSGTQFVSRMAALRHEAQRGEDAPKAGEVAPPRSGFRKGAAQLGGLGLDAKIVRQHGGDLKGAVAGLARLARAAEGRDAWQAKAYERVLGQAHKTLATLLTALPAEARAEAARATVEAWADLVEDVQGRAAFALSSALGLLDSGLRMEARRKLHLDDASIAHLGTEGAATVRALVDATRGRDGVTTTLNVLPRLVEQLELTSEGLDGPARRALVASVAEFMLETLPKTGVTLADAAALAQRLAAGSKAHPGKSDRILSDAKAGYLAERRPAWDEARAKVDAPPRPELAGVYEAMQAILTANPAGPTALFESLDRLRAVADAQPNADVLSAFAEVIGRAAEGPHAVAAAELLAAHGARIGQTPAAVQALKAGLAQPGPGALAHGLLDALTVLYPPGDPAAWAKAKADTVALDDVDATQVIAALYSAAPTNGADHDLLAALTDRARAGVSDASLADLQGFATRWAGGKRAVDGHAPLAGQRRALLTEIAAHTNAAFTPQQANALAAVLTSVQQRAPHADLAALMGPNGDAPGLLAIAAPPPGIITPPQQTLQQLLDAAGPVKEDPSEVVRAAMQIADQAAFIQNGRNAHIPRMVEDFGHAVKNPKGLHPATAPKSQVALRVDNEQPSAIGYLRRHVDLPVDLAFSAARHLSPDQVAWVISRVGGTKGLDTIRMLRDAVFGCVEAGRPDLIEAMRTSKSPPKAIQGAIREVAQNFRTRTMNAVPIDEVIAGLQAGEDPIAKLEAKRVQEALGGLDLNALAEGKVTAEGLQEIEAQSANLGELLTQYQTKFQSMDRQIDMGKLAPVLHGALKSVLQGTWPAPKYEDDIAKRQLAVLSPAQQAIWRRSTVVSADAPVAEAAGASELEAMALLRGLAVKIPEEVMLPEGLALDAANAARLQGELKDVLTKLRAGKKGSKAHRELGHEAGRLSTELALVELFVALQKIGAGADPTETLVRMHPLLEAGQKALRRMGAEGCAAAVTDAAFVARGLTPSGAAAGGRYAADQDSFTAMIASHQTGCLSKGSNLRRWGLAGSLVDANTKMLRVFNGDKQVYRTFLRMLPVKIGGYEGPALFIETPVGDRGGSAADLTLLNQALREKARQMGVPAIGGDDAVPEGWETVPNAQVTLTFDRGHTGLYHSDRLGQQIRQDNPEDTWDVQGNRLNVCAPPAIADKF